MQTNQDTPLGPITYTAEELKAAGLEPIPNAATEKPVQQQTASSGDARSSGPGNASPEASQKAAPKRETVEVKTGGEIQPLIPKSMDEAYRFARMLAMTYNLAEQYYKLPDDKLTGGVPVNIIDLATARAVHAIQLGAEVGMPPAQAVQSILMLNGIGTIWGDTQLALVQRSGLMIHFKEYDEGEMWEKYNPQNKAESVPNRNFAWVCEVQRKGDPGITVKRFTIHDAIHAGIWGKKTWATHPGRMGLYKIRAFSLRDKFADVLKGLTHSREEFEGETIDVTPNGSRITPEGSGKELAGLLEHAPAQAVNL